MLAKAVVPQEGVKKRQVKLAVIVGFVFLVVARVEKAQSCGKITMI